MSTREDADRIELLQGTLDLLKRGWVSAEEGVPENSRAKFHRLTAKGRKQVTVETTIWERLARAIAGILRASGQEGRS